MERFWVVVIVAWVLGGALLGVASYLKARHQGRKRGLWTRPERQRSLQDSAVIFFVWPLLVSFVVVLLLCSYGLPFDEVSSKEGHPEDRLDL